MGDVYKRRERGVQSVQGGIRTMRSAEEEKWGVELDTEHMVWPWLVEYAAYMLTRAEVGADGKTAYERSRGKVAKLAGVEFGEGVMWKRRREGGRKKRKEERRDEEKKRREEKEKEEKSQKNSRFQRQ